MAAMEDHKSESQASNAMLSNMESETSTSTLGNEESNTSINNNNNSDNDNKDNKDINNINNDSASSVSNNVNDSDGINSDADEEKGYIILNLDNTSDLIELDNAFNKITESLNKQKEKLRLQWYDKNNRLTKDSTDKNLIKIKHRILIDLQCIVQRIERIGMLEGKQYSELENEQNKAISELSKIVGLEEAARVASEKAIQLAKETELEMKEIDNKREIIKNKLEQAEPELMAARLAVKDIDDRALNELLSLKKPPMTVTNVLTVAVWIVNSSTNNASNPGTPRGSGSGSGRNSGSSSRRSSGKAIKTGKNGKNTKNGKKSHKRRQRDRAQSQSHSIQVSLEQSALNPIDESTCRVNVTERPQSAKYGSSRSRSRSNSRTRANSGFSDSNGGSKRNSASSITSSGGNGIGISSKRNSGRINKIDKLKSRSVDKILTQSWSDTRVMLTRGNFKKSVLEFEPKNLPKYVCKRIENEFLILEDFTIIRANLASKVLGPLVAWILSIIGYTTIWYSLEPMAEQIRELKKALDIKNIELVKVKNIANESQRKVIQIRTQMLKMVGYHKIGDLYFLS